MPYSFKSKLSLPVALILLSQSIFAQWITHGPVIGGVTDHSCKIYLRTNAPAKVKVIFSANSSLSDVLVAEGITTVANDQSTMVHLTDLYANTKYYYRLEINGHQDTTTGSFKTFPKVGQPGDYTFVAGSCQETPNMDVFKMMPLHEPYFLMHMGDYTYPDYMIARDYADTQWGIDSSYRRRYNEKIMKQMLYTVPMDYVFDDDDYVGAGAGRYCTNDFKTWKEKGRIYYSMPADTFPPHWRSNVIKGYADYFPHYDLPDTTEGIFHSFKFGNAEFFVLDRNSAKDFPDGDAFKYNAKKRKWEFAPDSALVLFGKKQMDWLKKSLLASTADWKFIVSGVPLNGACKKFIDAGINLQQLQVKGWTGFQLALGFSRYWVGYPVERNDFMKFVKDNSLKNIIVISGDTHHNVMDDGKNAGFPEINASGLSVATTELAKYLKLIGNVTGQYRMKKIWNKGGNGLTSRENKNAFGKVRIVNKKYVELSVVDETNKVVSSFKVLYNK